MPREYNSTKVFTPINSILVDPKGDDDIRPYTQTEWLERVQEPTSGSILLRDEYNKYIRAWNDLKKKGKSFKSNKKQRYISLLKNVALNYTTDEEKRFLSNIDYNNPRHVESSLSFFTTKLKEITEYFATERENIKYNSIKNAFTGSKLALSKQTQAELYHILSEENLKTPEINIPQNIRQSKTIINIVDLYEYETVINNDYQIDSTIATFNDFEEAISECLENCTPLLQLSEELVFSVTEQIDNTAENIAQLEYEWFSNYIKDQENLNILNEKQFVENIAGGDGYAVIDGELTELYKAKTPWRDYYSRNLPTINRLRPKHLLSRYEIGSLFIPSKSRTLTYYSFAPNLKITSLQQDEILNNVTNSATMSTSAADYIEDITWLKADAANDGLFGDIVNDESLPRFFTYRSDNEILGFTRFGMSRSTDPVGFFTNESKPRWSNDDIFKRDYHNIYPIDERQETLLVGKETVVKWSSDIFGNEYGLYKHIQTLRDPDSFAAGESADDYATDSVCQIIDGGDTFKTRPPLWTPGISYKIHEGGRRGGVDPKFEQRYHPATFEDLRRTITIVNPDGVPETRLEPFNSHYMAPNDKHTELVVTRISFHGFIYKDEQPLYDQQAYCGLFTDETCGRIDPSQRQCVVRDNYAFGTFSDTVSTINGKEYYVSTTEPVTGSNDAFEVYFNTGYMNDLDEDEKVLFTNIPSLSDSQVFENEDIDGNRFSEELCEPGDAEYITNESKVSEYINYQDNVSRTRYDDITTDDVMEMTDYEKYNRPNGRLVFRSSDGHVIDDIIEVLSESLIRIGSESYKQYDREIIRDQVINNQIKDMDVYGEVLVLHTETHTYIERLLYDPVKRTMKRSNTPALTLKNTTDNNTIETGFKHYYNEKQNRILCGHTRQVEIDEKSFAQPIIYFVDVETITTKSLVIDTEYITFSDELSSFYVESVDTPVTTYNDLTDVYTLSYTCKLTDGQKTSTVICVFDIIETGSGPMLLNCQAINSTPVDPYTSSREKWEKKDFSRIIAFPDDLTVPTSNDLTYTLKTTTMFGEVFKGHTLELEFNTKTLPIPTNGMKINQIIFEPNDGGDKVYRHRELQTGAEPISFDIAELPDQSDFADPRIVPIKHTYNFASDTNQTIVSTLTVIYANNKKLIVRIEVETEPYTIESAFDSIKLIQTKSFNDKLGRSKQLYVLESQNPRQITTAVTSKMNYTNSSIIGKVDGKLYAGPYHEMSDGSLMTQATHTPVSQPIIPL